MLGIKFLNMIRIIVLGVNIFLGFFSLVKLICFLIFFLCLLSCKDLECNCFICFNFLKVVVVVFKVDVYINIDKFLFLYEYF